MNRQPSTWMHRSSRPLMGAIAGLGLITTGYLTAIKLTQSAVACPNASCDLVLQSDYATVFGQPLALFGCLAYTAMLILALAPLAVSEPLRSQWEDSTWTLLLIGAIAMSVFSGYLVYLLAFEIKTICLYCIASALFSVSLLVLTIIGRYWEDVGQVVFTSIIVGIVAIVGTLGIYADVNAATTSADSPISLMPSGQPTPGIGWAITTTSGQSEIALARHLKEIGAKEYFAWWCPHCHEQKQLFGKEAYRELTQVDCAPVTENLRLECQAANIESFPTWIIDGKSYQGVQSLEQLAQISGYTGTRNFKNFPGVF